MLLLLSSPPTQEIDYTRSSLPEPTTTTHIHIWQLIEKTKFPCFFFSLFSLKKKKIMWGRKHHESARSATTAPVCVPISLFFSFILPQQKKTHNCPRFACWTPIYSVHKLQTHSREHQGRGTEVPIVYIGVVVCIEGDAQQQAGDTPHIQNVLWVSRTYNEYFRLSFLSFGFFFFLHAGHVFKRFGGSLSPAPTQQHTRKTMA